VIEKDEKNALPKADIIIGAHFALSFAIKIWYINVYTYNKPTNDCKAFCVNKNAKIEHRNKNIIRNNNV
jgi:hypothetical protein